MYRPGAYQSSLSVALSGCTISSLKCTWNYAVSSLIKSAALRLNEKVERKKCFSSREIGKSLEELTIFFPWNKFCLKAQEEDEATDGKEQEKERWENYEKWSSLGLSREKRPREAKTLGSTKSLVLIPMSETQTQRKWEDGYFGKKTSRQRVTDHLCLSSNKEAAPDSGLRKLAGLPLEVGRR